jgi:hypothetical protein
VVFVVLVFVCHTRANGYPFFCHAFAVIPLYGGVSPNGDGVVVFVLSLPFAVILREVAGSIGLSFSTTTSQFIL